MAFSNHLRIMCTRCRLGCSAPTFVVSYLAVLIILCQWTCTSYAAPESNISCASVRYSYEGRGLTAREVPKDPLSGLQLRVCRQGVTCCTAEMEGQLGAHSKRLLDAGLKESLATLSAVLKARALKFDEFFKELLLKSKHDFHEMFKRTYGIIYEQNSYVFTDLFEELERYYAKGRVDLVEAMENFFTTLYQKMFTVLNAQYHFDDKYLVCVSEHMKELKPFGDVPHKLSMQLKRSFVATRTFAQSLSVAGDIVNNMITLGTSGECSAAVMKMSHCPACSGLPDLRPCTNYCANVMKGCLAYHAELDPEWNGFVDAIDKVVERLLGPFNIEMVVEPIDIKISEAIMNFQENSQQVSQKVFSGCGKPLLGRRRRSSDTSGAGHRTELSLETLQFGTDKGNDGGTGSVAEAGGLGLDRLLKDIRSRIKETRQFWSRLPYHMCHEATGGDSAKDDACWNGARKARYELQVIGDGLSNQQANPELRIDVSRPSSLLNEQVFALKTISSKLRNAYNGMDVEWIDIEDSYGSGSGSGWSPVDSTDDTEAGGDDGDDDEGDGSGGGGLPTERSDTAGVAVGGANTEDNRLHPVGGEGQAGGKVRYNVTVHDGTANNAAVNHPGKMSLGRALIAYLVPVVLVWLGNAVTEWIHLPAV